MTAIPYWVPATCRHCAKCALHVLYWIDVQVYKGKLHHTHAQNPRALFLITCTLYLWHRLLTRPPLLSKFSQPHYTICPANPSMSCSTSLASSPTTLLQLTPLQPQWPFLSSWNMPNTHGPPGPWTYCFICLEPFSSDTHPAAFSHHSVLYSNIILQWGLPLAMTRKQHRALQLVHHFPFPWLCLIFVHHFYHLLTYFMIVFHCLPCFIRSPVLFTCFLSN